MLTGQYSHENGVYTPADELNRDRKHVVHHLQDPGYRTAVIGKWHLTTEPSGFDYYNVLPSQGRYRGPLLKELGDEWRTRS